MMQWIFLGFAVAIISGVFGLVIYVVGFEFDRVFTLGLDRKPAYMSQKRWEQIKAMRK